MGFNEEDLFRVKRCKTHITGEIPTEHNRLCEFCAGSFSVCLKVSGG